MKIAAAVPVLQVADVERSVDWYRDLLGFSADTFPPEKPYTFAIMVRDQCEFMMQCASANSAPRNSAPKYSGWSVYFRLNGGELMTLFESVRQKWTIIRSPERMFYNMVEFEIDDLDGHRLVFGEELGPEVDVPSCRG